jgi:hypothetical protein
LLEQVYLIQVTMGQEKWQVYRRFREFDKLLLKVTKKKLFTHPFVRIVYKKCPKTHSPLLRSDLLQLKKRRILSENSPIKLPPKRKIGNNFASDFLNARMKQLNEVLQKLCASHFAEQDVQEFLSPSVKEVRDSSFENRTSCDSFCQD